MGTLESDLMSPSCMTIIGNYTVTVIGLLMFGIISITFLKIKSEDLVTHPYGRICVFSMCETLIS